jgi:hypothetical protein
MAAGTTADGDTDQMLRALAASTPDARVELTMLAARGAEFAGWMAQESGDVTAALWWTRKAVRMAGEAGMHDLATYALVREALVTLYQRDGAATVELARRAQVDLRVPFRIRGSRRNVRRRGMPCSAPTPSACAADLLSRPAVPPRAGEPTIGTSNVSDPVVVATG